MLSEKVAILTITFEFGSEVMNKSAQLHKRILTEIVIILVLSMTYAVLRYNILGTVPLKDIPLFILNKAVSLSSLILLTASF